MTWEEILNEYRALGGIAENVRLGEGPYGRGLFAVDPALPARIHTPDTLFVRSEDVEVRGGAMRVKETSTLGARERAFFEHYERFFGWGPGPGAGGYEEVRRAQQSWNELPADVINAVGNIGGLEDPEKRFLPPSPDICLYQYLRCRYFGYRDATYIVPVTDMVNHSDAAASYVVDFGLGVSGTFDGGELLARYSGRDAWSNAMTYGFTTPSLYAYSLKIDVGVFDKRLSIGRDVSEYDVRDGVRMPRVHLAGDTIRFPYLTLGNASAPDSPRAIFRKSAAPWLTVEQADNTFDSVARFNRVTFVNALRVLQRHRGPLVDMLADGALNQLEALSNCIGARPL